METRERVEWNMGSLLIEITTNSLKAYKEGGEEEISSFKPREFRLGKEPLGSKLKTYLKNLTLVGNYEKGPTSIHSNTSASPHDKEIIEM